MDPENGEYNTIAKTLHIVNCDHQIMADKQIPYDAPGTRRDGSGCQTVGGIWTHLLGLLSVVCVFALFFGLLFRLA